MPEHTGSEDVWTAQRPVCEGKRGMVEPMETEYNFGNRGAKSHHASNRAGKLDIHKYAPVRRK